MIKEDKILITGHPRNLKYFIKKGYNPIVKVDFLINTTDLMPGSAYKITSICDECGGESNNAFKDYYNYTNGLNDKFYCSKCKSIKYKKTCLDKYGVDNVMKLDITKENLKITIKNKYGVDHYSETREYKEKYKKTCLDKYGVENSFMFFKDKIKDTSFEKYGGHYMSMDSVKKELKYIKEDNTKRRYIDYIDDDFIIVSYESDTFLIKHKICNCEFIIGKGLLRSRISQKVCICTICNKVGVQFSSIESELIDFLKENNIEFIKNSRKIIDKLELDIFIPSKNIALEINGVYWHNELYKKKDYHLNKTNLCNKSGIELLHIWEDDWKHKKNIIKSILLNRLELISDRIYSRKCIIGLVSSSESRDFLDKNHIQGFSSSQLKIGLFYDKKLVSLMTFGFRYTNGVKEYELIRFCNLINTSVIGSASKLFSFFIKKYDVSRVVSYSDISMFSGRLYDSLNFEKSSKSSPNYFWVVDGIRKHRFNFNKKKLVKMGFDSNKTEVEIMHDNKNYRIWGCGHQKWIFNK